MSLLTDALRRLLRRPRKVPVSVPVATLVIGLLVGSGSAYALVVTGSMIQDGTVTAADLATNSVGSAEIGNDAVNLGEIRMNAVRASEIYSGAVATSEVLDNSLTATDLAMDAVGSSEIATGAVKAAEIDTGAVNSAAIGTDAVDSSEIKLGAVKSIEIFDNTIVAADINSDFLAEIVNQPSRVYIPNGDASGWSGAPSADSLNVVNTETAVYDVAANPCGTGKSPVGVQAVLFNGASADFPSDGNPLTFSDGDLNDPDVLSPTVPLTARWTFKPAPSPRFFVHVPIDSVVGNVNDVALMVECL